MKERTIAILVDAPLLYAGVERVVETMKNVEVYNLRDYETDEEELENIDLLIVDPLLREELCCYELPNDLKIVGVIYQVLPASSTDGFNDTVNIYDSVESMVDKFERHLTTNAREQKGGDLSPREKDVIQALVKGKSNKEIAAEMNVSVNTVMTHRRNIAAKLQIHSPAGLTIFAIATGLVKLDEVKNMLDI